MSLTATAETETKDLPIKTLFDSTHFFTDIMDALKSLQGFELHS